ncbi:MAG: histidine phosphatase family protein [Alphaproteobacteria bacterium]|nr:histidine phosphatase family protein [Alphaproteobacteria bacterium]MCB9974369.1 histidine phosphatase family protein [Rhodospirillales bacterium]
MPVRQLYLLRHALTLPAEPGQEDQKRVLAPKGLEDARALAKAVKEKRYLPDYVLCSPAMRTRQTFAPLEDKLEMVEVSSPSVLYTGSAGDLLSAIQNTGPAYERVLLVSHNPSISQLAKILARGGGASLLQRVHEGFKPGTFAAYSFSGDDWADLTPEGAELIDIMDPLDYNAPATPARWT